MAISSSSRGLRPGVCTSTTRPANPYDGMVIYETDTDKVAVYDVNAWVYKTGTTAPAAPVAPGLVLISSGTLSGSSTTFSSVFSADYDNYEIIVTNAEAAVSTPSLFMTIGSISTGYTRGIATNNGAYSYTGSQSSFDIGYAGNAANSNVYSKVFLINPFLTLKKTLYGIHIWPANQVYDIYGEQEDTTSCTSLTLTMSSSTFSGGNCRIYGYQNS